MASYSVVFSQKPDVFQGSWDKTGSLTNIRRVGCMEMIESQKLQGKFVSPPEYVPKISQMQCDKLNGMGDQLQSLLITGPAVADSESLKSLHSVRVLELVSVDTVISMDMLKEMGVNGNLTHLVVDSTATVDAAVWENIKCSKNLEGAMQYVVKLEDVDDVTLIVKSDVCLGGSSELDGDFHVYAKSNTNLKKTDLLGFASDKDIEICGPIQKVQKDAFKVLRSAEKLTLRGVKFPMTGSKVACMPNLQTLDMDGFLNVETFERVEVIGATEDVLLGKAYVKGQDGVERNVLLYLDKSKAIYGTDDLNESMSLRKCGVDTLSVQELRSLSSSKGVKLGWEFNAVEDNAFAELREVEELVLEDAKFELTEDMLNQMPKLKCLKLINTSCDGILKSVGLKRVECSCEANSILGEIELERVSLDVRKVSFEVENIKIDTATLGKLKHVEKLRVDGFESEIPEAVLSKLPKLKQLELRGTPYSNLLKREWVTQAHYHAELAMMMVRVDVPMGTQEVNNVKIDVEDVRVFRGRSASEKCVDVYNPELPSHLSQSHFTEMKDCVEVGIEGGVKSVDEDAFDNLSKVKVLVLRGVGFEIVPDMLKKMLSLEKVVFINSSVSDQMYKGASVLSILKVKVKAEGDGMFVRRINFEVMKEGKVEKKERFIKFDVENETTIK